MTGVVIASRTLKTAYIFPAKIQGTGWSAPDNVRTQQLSGSAPFESFTQSNAAYIIQGELPRVVPDPEVITPPPPVEEESPPAEEPPPAPPTEESEEEGDEETATTTPPTENPPQETASSTEESSIPSEETPAPEPTPDSTSSPQAEPTPAPQSEVPAPSEPPPPAPEDNASTTTSAFFGESLLSFFLPKVSAQEIVATTTPPTETSTVPIIPGADVATCVVLNKPCYTLELSGFGVDGSLKEKNLERVEVNFSFANRIASTNTSDKLTVKYFHNGAWKTGGEVFVNKDHSNALNGGYFTQVLEDIRAWDDLSQIKVVVEYERENEEVAVEAYIDSLWLTAVYREPVQQVVQGGGSAPEPTDVPENVDFTLSNEGGIDPSKLVLPDGMHLFFLYVDDLDEDELVIRADKQEYANNVLTRDGDGSNVVYMSVTNTGSVSDEFKLQAAFKGGAVREMQQFVHNIPAIVVEEPELENGTSSPEIIVTGTSHTCPARWQRGDQAYRCSATSEEYMCASITVGGTVCFVESEETVSSAPEIISSPREEKGVPQHYTSGWIPVNMPRTEDPTEYPAPGSYVVENISDTLVIHAGQTLYFRAVLDTVTDPQQFIFFAVGDNYEGDLDSTKLRDELTWVQEGVAPVVGEKKPTTVRISSRDNFDGDELPEFKFKFKTQRGVIMRLFNSLIGRENNFTVPDARLVDTSGEETTVPFRIEYGEDGEWTLELKQQPRSFRPGKYSLEFSVVEDGNTYTDTVEFYWGVLAVNTNKSIYEPGEEVALMMAALTESGDTICDATLELVITDPNGYEMVSPVRQSGQCGDNNVTNVADYLSEYSTGPSGRYEIQLAQIGGESNVVHQVRDSFEVQESAPFVIARRGATRIWPVANYTMELSLSAVSDFKGEFIEAIPEDFVVVDSDGAESTIYGGAKRLIWKVDLEAGETVRFTYEYDAPDISPYLYLLGPAEVRAGEALPFTEARQWKLASDAVGNMLLLWDQTWIPTGWTCVSCLPADAFYQRFIMGSSTAGTNGGAATHTHTATGNVPATGSGGDSDTAGGGADVALNTHTHSYTPVIDSPSNLPPYRHLAVIQYNSTGNPTQIPAGAIAMFDVASSSLPASWYRLSALDGRFVRAESTSTIGTTGGAATHLHAISGNTGGPSATTNASGATVAISTNAHTHAVTANTASVNHEPPYIDTLYARLSATTSPTNDMIAMFSGDPATGWTTVSSSTEVFASRFGKASTTYSTTQYGSQTHTHANVTGIVIPASAATVNRTTTGASDAVGAHTHTGSVTAFSTTNHLPPYRTAVFAKRAGGDTPPITLHDVPFESEKTGSSTPAIEFTSHDPDGSSDLIYNVQWDDDADLDVSPIGNASSTDETGCSPNCFQNLVSTGDTSPFNEAERIRYRIQTPLVSGTTYYWRVRARESGTATWGAWATTTSFTYIANTDPSQWFQTDDAQFETGTLIDTETTGDGGVQIAVNNPVEALIAYGEGAVTTPRYQIWDGANWGGEGSALDVGGQIQWVITRAAPTRREYIVGTQDTGADVNVQVYDVDAGTWGDLQEVIGGAGGVAELTNRGFDIAYETDSGDALVVYCDGNADPSYYVWDGSTWTSGALPPNLGSANNCEWIRLASDPASDEIIMVSRDTGTVYEAQVWDGSVWGDSTTLGSMSDALHEGIAVEYEESGNQAVVVASNANNPSFVWKAWDGTQWSAVASTETLGNDFEWGKLIRDVGNDTLTLCYADESDDLGFIHWDGDGWLSPFIEFETSANVGATADIDGQVVSCENEVTTGRDHLVMMPYSDATNARYQYASTTASGEASVSTIGNSWTVSTARTGEGKILAVFNDDDSTQYDFSYWNGSVWSNIQTLEGTPSDTTEPYSEPVYMAAEIFVPSEGTITSAPVDFDLVAGQPTWGEVLWNTTEPTGTDVQLQVMYGASCSSLVPDIDLPGNAASFQATSSPLDLSSLSTTTYNQLCLKARLSSQSQNNPTLDDWTISWERQPYLTQADFKWYVNAASLTPSDIWPSGGTDLNLNDAISTSFAPILGNVLRLRMNVLTENVSLSSNALSLRLQYAEGATCEADMTWLDVGAVGSTTADWRGYDNGGVSDGATLPSNLLSTSDVSATYEEQNDSSLNPSTATNGQETEWDWALQHNAPNATSYCFRAITSDNTVLNEYDRYPALVTNTRPNTPLLEMPFDNEELASTTPWFEFAAEDPEGNDVTYQIQIDDNNDFSSTFLDRDSQTNFTEFTNIITPADKDPFNSAQAVRFVPTSALSNGTTYYWRVRAKDRNASNDWSDWSSTYSVTVNTGVTISTWMQTTQEQFDTDTHEDSETSGSDDVIISTSLTSATTTSTAIDFDDKTTGNAWGELSWTDNETAGDIKYHVEYLNVGTWTLIPDADLSGNAAGYDTSPISLLGLSPTTYNEIRLRANMTDSGGTPRLQQWRVEWGYAVEQPTLTALFDNEKTGTTTPTFRFVSSDPQNDDLIYQISWSTTNDFVASTTRNSDVHAGFRNTASSTDTSPFEEADSIEFQMQQADALSNNTTYWWRVRARDPNGDNVWSTWSSLRSFTVDTTVAVSTWFQTTDSQFQTDTLSDSEVTGSGGTRITSIIREAMIAYGESTTQVPRYKIWSGSSWGTEGSGVSIGDTIRFVELAASPTRDEYVMATMGSTGVVDAQVYTGGLLDAWGTSTEVVAVAPNILRRGFDIAYETSSGDAIAVACSGTEAVYKVWDGTSWSGSNPITLGVTNNCEWIKLVSDPTSDEIILVARDTTLGAVDYYALVWNGGGWGNGTTTGSQVTPNNEGIAIEYEESGGQAVMVTSNGANNNFTWKAWDGSNWSLPQNVAIVNDFAAGRMCRDDGSDNMALIVMDIEADLSYVLWDGSGWGTISSEFETFGNSANGRPISCEYEVTAGRDGYVMMPYSDTGQAEAVYWDGALLNGPTVLNTIGDSWEVRTARTGDGNILAAYYDDGTTEYDFTYWNGSTWSAEEIIENNSIANLTPRTIPLDIVARQYPSFTSGNVVSSAIDFDDGLGPKWQELSWSDTTPGSSDILYQVEYYSTASSTWALIPDSALTYNSTGATTSPRSLAGLSRITYNTLRLKANLNCVAGNCPTLNDWTVKWSEGIVVSGTAHAYDQSTNVTSGTVALAVNGTLQAGKTATISGGTWSIANVTAFDGDVITVYIDGAADPNEAAAVTVYDGDGDITDIPLYERHLTIGSVDNETITNANIASYDYSASLNDEDLFFDVDASNDLTVCAIATCNDAELYVKSGNTYRPDSTSSGNVSTHDIENNGTITADGNTFYVNGSWDNNSVFTANTSSVIFTATSTTEAIDSTGASTASFNNITLGQTSGTATWNQSSYLDINGVLSITYGTLSPGSSSTTIAGNFSISTNGVFTKGTATTTFDGTGSSTFTDSTTAKQDMGKVAIDGSTKTVLLGAAAKVTDLTIGSDDTFSVDNNYALEVLGNWTNNNSFLSQSGTVTFTSTATGKTITPGSSSFYNMTFNGVGGNWAFIGNTVTATNDLSVYNGIPTFPTATTTIGGSLNATSSSFMHNNGAVVFNSSSAKTVRPGSSSFYDLGFSGSGSWSFTDGYATSSRHTTITTGTVTMPSGVLAVGGSFTKDGGTLTHNSGTLKLTATGAQTVKLGGSDAYNLTFNGVGGSWSFTDTNATSTNTVRFDNGTATLPSGFFAVGGSWTVTSGAFTHNSGTVKFNSSDTGETVNPGASPFRNLTFDNAAGGWTISAHATSTGTTTLANASSFTLASGQSLEVGSAFVNSVGGAATTWTGSTLFLNSGTSYSINGKTGSGDTYGTLSIGANTDVKMWNSSADAYSVNSSGSLYSQDHAAVDGDLYIWGDYVANSDEYWAYANDFDGTALGGSSRQVDVRFASGANMTFASGTLRMLGISTATTTLANQGSGTYGFTMTAGTLNAQYYSIRNTDANGFYILGTPTVSSFANGDFELGVNGGASLSLAATVINQNPALQIQQVTFATSSGVTSGYNVVASTTASSYWWFRNHYGNYDGENFDNDLGGNPGYIRWDDSSLVITVSGRVFSDHGTTAIGNPPCDGSNNVRIVVTGLTVGSFTGSCDGGTGAYSIPGVTFSGDVTLTAYLNTDGGAKAVTVSKTPTTDIEHLDLYQNSVIVRHEDTAAMTIADMATYDFADDSDIPFTAATGSPNTLVVQPNTELFVWSQKSFTPGGNMTLDSGGSGSERDGRLFMATSSTLTAGVGESHSVGGGFTARTGSTFTAASNSTFTFAATTTGKSINADVPLSFYNLTFNGSGGGWSLDSTATTTVQNNFLMTLGSLSGTSTAVVSSGDLTGNGTIAMTGGTFVLETSGNFGGTSPWQFRNLTLGSGTTATTTKTGTGTTTVSGIFRLQSSQIFEAGNAPIVLSGGGTPFVRSGTFRSQSAPFYYTATTSTSIADTTYAALTFAPADVGTPTYTLLGGTLTASSTRIGDTNPVTVNANTNDPSLNVTGNVTIGTGSTFVASNVGAFDVGGSWSNSGTFTHSNGSVRFNSTDTGESVAPGVSPFYDLEFNSSGGGWTVSESATTTRLLTLSAASSFTVAPGTTLSVGGTFTNSVGGAATVWSGSTLALVSGTSYSANAKTSTGDTYNTLYIAPNTDVRIWNSSSGTTTVDTTSSLYSQDNAGVDGDLYIWGDYTRSSGSDYWSFETDFDGTALGGSGRQVDVRIATSSSVTLSGGILDIIGTTTATTTIANQGTGRYALAASGGTLNAQYYSVRNTNPAGLSLSGSPVISSLSNGDYELDVDGGTMMTVAGSVITANPLKIISRTSFSTTTNVATGANVTATGSTASSWKFNLHYGNYDGEPYDSDPTGDPGYLRWDDSAAQITVEGNVYDDEGTTVASVCDGSSQVVRLLMQGLDEGTSSCDPGTGLFSISNVAFNPGDVMTLFLDGTTTKAVNISIDPVTNISDMHLYANRVIVRHEDTAPLNIADMVVYDNDQDSDIMFDAEDAATDTLTLPSNTKLIVWDEKTFAPAGNITINSGAGTAWDGTLELRATSTLSAAGSQSHIVGGSFILGSGATFSPANSTVTFTATTTGKTITPRTSSFYNIVFNGVAGNWAFTGSATSSNDFTITNGTVTLPSSTTTVGGSFQNTATVPEGFMHNNGALVLTSTASGKSIRVNGSNLYSLIAEGSGGAWSFVDTNATTSNNFIVTVGSITLPSGILAVGSSFQNSGTVTHNSGTVKLTAATAGKTVQSGGSSFYNLSLNGVGGEWDFVGNATTTNNFTITNGSTTLPNQTAIGGSFVNQGAFAHNSGTVRFTATATGKSVTASSSPFYNVIFNGTGGGWTVTGSATTTNDFTLTTATNFTLTQNSVLSVGGIFTNSVGGSATTWATTTVALVSGTSYSINTKSAGGDIYGTLYVASSTDIRAWNSSAATTSVDSNASLYSQDHAAVDGDLYIWGEYIKSSGTDYWSYATDFDGTVLGSPRQVDVRIATSSSVSISGGTLNIVGATGGATTTIANQGTGRYTFAITAGTLNANYYQIRNTDPSGLSLSGTPTITSLAYGDFELAVQGGTMLTVDDDTINANASLVTTNVRFATSSGIMSGYNITRTGTPVSAWTFSGTFGNYDGEAFDNDGGDACGFIRWSDSSCLFVSQEHYRWRNDDGGEGVPDTEWYNASWTKRKRLNITNNTDSAYTNVPVKVVIDYDADMQVDFDDLRFTDSTGTSSISYWLEDKVNSASSTIWVEVPSLPASGSAIVYMYYGNNSVSTASDGDTTFAFFDDFEDDDISEYSGDTSLFDVDTTYANTGTYGLDAGVNFDEQTTSGIRQTGTLTQQGQTIRFFQYVDADFDDEPCTLFGVGGAGSNYAVCLDQYPVDKVILAENVTSNDGSGNTYHASTTVTFVDGWYEVEIDWQSGGDIDVTVYDANGDVFASLSDTDTTHTSGGMGFSFWTQHGGWDTYMVRPYAATDPSYTFGTEQGASGATWKAAEDTRVIGQYPNENVRLRFSVQNTGADIFSRLFRLQVASKGSSLNCESVPQVNYNDVPTTAGGCGSAPACMVTSSQFGDQTVTGPLLPYPSAFSFASGQLLEDPSNQTASSSIPNSAATEIEYNLQMTNNASANAYCFRTTNGGVALDNYTKIAEVAMLHSPQISNLTLNSATNIVLTEGATTTVYASSTVTDNNGYTDLLQATSTIYRSGVGSGALCTHDENNCYQIASSSCSFSGCSGNTCSLQCTAEIQYFADATDVGSSYAGENWLSSIQVEDTSGERDVDTSFGVELLTLYGLSVDSSINYGALEVGQNTGAVNATTEVNNTGNSNIDIQLAGTDLTSGQTTIPVGAQKFSTTTFAYGSCSICDLLTGSATNVEVDLPKPTSTSTPSVDDVYWGIEVPTNTATILHSGTNTFIATSD